MIRTYRMAFLYRMNDKKKEKKNENAKRQKNKCYVINQPYIHSVRWKQTKKYDSVESMISTDTLLTLSFEAVAMHTL